jgi:hypothetical protein
MSREVSAGIRQNVLSSLQNSLASIEFERLCRTSTISSIQVLILLTMCDELNGNGSASPFLKLGAAIRMAQELVSALPGARPTTCRLTMTGVASKCLARSSSSGAKESPSQGVGRVCVCRPMVGRSARVRSLTSGCHCGTGRLWRSISTCAMSRYRKSIRTTSEIPPLANGPLHFAFSPSSPK